MRKNLMLLLTVITITLSSFSTTPGPNKQVRKTFKENFPAATDVVWSVTKNIHTASFISNDKSQKAYYSADGEYLGQAWQVTLQETPWNVQYELSKDTQTSEIKSITLFFQPESYPIYRVVTEKNGKRSVKEIDSYGNSNVVWKKKIRTI